ncbi:hypothetical protein F4808DRAFT_467174 [Astrocystis sublimbata]|nr:hypothetical protein F4808DRAFT_467174 [Astrocystis sublimbata]
MADPSEQFAPSPIGSVSSTEQAGTQGNNVYGALGSVLGYIGAEVATPAAFERLLWPQRYYSNFKLKSAPSMAVLAPMSGPLHKIGLAVMDKIFQHGILKGPHQGHMLGTAFFPELGWTYTMHSEDENFPKHTEPLRNCLWARALARICIPTIHSHDGRGIFDNVEKAYPSALRARVTVSHITLTPATPADRASMIPFVSEDTRTPGIGVFLGVITSELSAIVTATVIFAIQHSPWAFLWLIPLSVRLSDGNFMLMTGPSTLVLQFFRHYGHPKRDRFKEIAQLISIVLFLCILPFELVVSIILMPINLQYVWLGYQIYVILMMHICRYSHWGNPATTEGKIAEAFSKQIREGPETLKATLSITYHSRYREGQETMRVLLRGVDNQVPRA